MRKYEHTHTSTSHMTFQPVLKAPSLGIHDPEQYQKTATFSPDGRFLAVAGTDGRLQLHRYPSMMPVFSVQLGVISLKEEIYDTDFSDDSRQLAVTTPSRIVIFSTTPKTTDGNTQTYSPRILQVLEKPVVGGSTAASFRTGKFGRGAKHDIGTRHRFFTLINAHAEKGGRKRPSYVVTWDADAWRVKSAYTVSTKPSTTMAVSPHGRYVAVGSSDMCVTLLHALTSKRLLRIDHAHGFPPTCLAFSPNSRMLVSASADSSVQLTLLPSNLVPSLMISDEILFIAFVIAVLLMALLIPHFVHS